MQASVWLPTAPVIEHWVGPEAFDQPAAVVPAGSGSDRLTPFAVPGPPLVTVTVKPIGSPAFTVAASAVLVTDKDGFRHVMLAEADAFGAFDALAVAVLL